MLVGCQNFITILLMRVSCSYWMSLQAGGIRDVDPPIGLPG